MSTNNYIITWNITYVYTILPPVWHPLYAPDLTNNTAYHIHNICCYLPCASGQKYILIYFADHHIHYWNVIIDNDEHSSQTLTLSEFIFFHFIIIFFLCVIHWQRVCHWRLSDMMNFIICTRRYFIHSVT